MLEKKQRPRIYYTQEQKKLMWDRWQAGDSTAVIARLFDRGHSSVQGVLAETGGVRPRSRNRSPRVLNASEREDISRNIVAGYSVRALAANLRRAPSTVSREIRRNGGRRCYRANEADQAAWDRARRPTGEFAWFWSLEPEWITLLSGRGRFSRRWRGSARRHTDARCESRRCPRPCMPSPHSRHSPTR